MRCPVCGSHDYYFDGLCDVCLDVIIGNVEFFKLNFKTI